MENQSVGKTILLERDCDALLIPHAHPLTLPQGSVVRITQALGGNFTLEVQGNLVLVLAEHRDALGFDVYDETKESQYLQDDSVTILDKAWYQIKQCYDPEIPVNIVDLGLIYDLNLSQSTVNAKAQHTYVTMTLTSPTCGMGPVIIEEVKRKLHNIPNVDEVTVELVFEPPWSRECMSEAAKLQLGLL